MRSISINLTSLQSNPEKSQLASDFNTSMQATWRKSKKLVLKVLTSLRFLCLD